jgi:hypothetical protein
MQVHCKAEKIKGEAIPGPPAPAAMAASALLSLASVATMAKPAFQTIMPNPMVAKALAETFDVVLNKKIMERSWRGAAHKKVPHQLKGEARRNRQAGSKL